MAQKTWGTNETLIVGDLNYYIRDLKQNACCITRADGSQKIWYKSRTGVFAQLEDFDPDGMHSTTVSPNLFTPTYAGYYYLTGFVEFAASAGGNYRQVETAVNGSVIFDQGKTRDLDLDATFSNFLWLTGAPTYLNGTGDNIQFTAMHDSPGDLNIHNAVIALCRIRSL